MKKMLLFATLFASGLAWAQAPKADLVDIQFNEDGTATDISPLANTLTSVGSPIIVKSPKYDRYVMCASGNTWNAITNGTFRFPLTESILTGIEDGFTMEVMVRPTWTGSIPGPWVSAFGFEQTGGSGIIIEDRTWRFETRSGGSYHTAVWNEPPVADQWVHLVGVWNKEEGKCYFYANGELKGQNQALGDYGLPSESCRFFYVGCDANPDQTGEASLPGDYAFVRLYSDPLTAEQVADVYGEIQALDTGAEEHDDKFTAQYDEEGYMIISTAEDLYTFGRMTKMGAVVNARLMNDIDYTGYNYSLASSNFNYGGEFDGQGHCITVDFHFDYEDCGLFDYTDSNAYIHDLQVAGKVSGTSKWTGVLVGDDCGSRIENILITADLTSTCSGEAFSALFTAYNTNTSRYKNIVVIGSINSETASACSGITSDIKKNCYMENCLSVVNINFTETDRVTPVYSRIRNNGLTCKNVFYVSDTEYEGFIEGVSSISMESVRNGKFCALMTNDDVNSIWRQTLGEDDTPVMNPDHGFVVFANETECVGVTEANLQASCSKIVDEGNAWADEAQAYPPLLDAYREKLAQLGTSATMADFRAYYPALVAAYHAIESNLDMYDEFKQKSDEALVQIDGLSGNFALQLKDYLSDMIEPCEDYPSGSAPYILENRQLDNDGIQIQLAYIEDMLKKVMAGDADPGTDISVMLLNADFSQEGKGWEGILPNVYVSEPPSAEFLHVEEGNIYQTLTGLKNGIYEFDINAFYSGNDVEENTGYGAMVYANGNEVPVMSLPEGVIPFDEAVDSVNCLITNVGEYPCDHIFNETYYIPNSRQGGSFALNGGRYTNRILVNVTDGKLTVGVRLDSDGNFHDWLQMAQARLFYQGEVAQAGDALNSVLAGYVARAQTTIAYEPNISGEEYLVYPNYSKSFRDALGTKVEAVATAADNEAKYQLIQDFTTIFQQIHASKLAYRQLAKAIIGYMDCGALLPELAEQIQAECDQAFDAWESGTFSTEEALAKAAELDKLVNDLMGWDKPLEADLVNVVFNPDGTATDISAMQNPVEMVNEVSVVSSPLLNQNVACFAHTHSWQSSGVGYYKIPMTDAIWEQLSDGFTIETYVRPYYEGGRPSGEVNPFSMQESGGFGILCTSSGYWCFEPHIDGYKTTVSDYEVTPGNWIHLVGVWDGGTVKFFVNGRLAAQQSASGTLGRPTGSNSYLVIGADYNPNNGAQAWFQGDVAVARLYSKPMADKQVEMAFQSIQNQKTSAQEHSETGDGVRDVIVSQPKAVKGIYNVMGQKLQRMQHGINIVDGQKLNVK